MGQYRVTWGEEIVVVEAADETEAWAKFCEGHALAVKHPKMHERTVEEVAQPKATPEAEVETEESPVDNLAAHDAIDTIARMRSVERLQEIVANDQRVTVVEAARKRLAELG